MSSSDGLSRLKYWQSVNAELLLTSVTLKGAGELFDVRVTVASVTESELRLRSVESADVELIDMRGITYADLSSIAGMELTLPSGKRILLREFH